MPPDVPHGVAETWAAHAAAVSGGLAPTLLTGTPESDEDRCSGLGECFPRKAT